MKERADRRQHGDV